MLDSLTTVLLNALRVNVFFTIDRIGSINDHSGVSSFSSCGFPLSVLLLRFKKSGTSSRFRFSTRSSGLSIFHIGSPSLSTSGTLANFRFTSLSSIQLSYTRYTSPPGSAHRSDLVIQMLVRLMHSAVIWLGSSIELIQFKTGVPMHIGKEKHLCRS